MLVTFAPVGSISEFAKICEYVRYIEVESNKKIAREEIVALAEAYRLKKYVEEEISLYMKKYNKKPGIAEVENMCNMVYKKWGDKSVCN